MPELTEDGDGTGVALERALRATRFFEPGTGLLDQMFDAVYVVDRRRRIVYWNRAAGQLTGYRPDEVVGSHCFDRVLNHVDESGCSLCTAGCPLSHAMVVGQPHQSRIFLHHRDGHRVPVSVRVVPLRDDDGRVIGAVEVFRDESSHPAQAPDVEELQRLALLDPLTGLPNRRLLEATIAARFDEMVRYGWVFGVLFMDIDHFKGINDDHGHAVGDRVLQMVGRTLASCSRPFDVVGRWGGEEFVGVAAHVDGPQLSAIARRFRALVEQSSFDLGERHLSVTISVGAVCVRAGDTQDSVVERADRLMYRAKRLGRNRVAVERVRALRPSDES